MFFSDQSVHGPDGDGRRVLNGFERMLDDVLLPVTPNDILGAIRPGSVNRMERPASPRGQFHYLVHCDRGRSVPKLSRDFGGEHALPRVILANEDLHLCGDCFRVPPLLHVETFGNKCI